MPGDDTADSRSPAALLREELRQHLPDFTYCRRCGRPVWGVESIMRGIGPKCAMLEALDELAAADRSRERDAPV